MHYLTVVLDHTLIIASLPSSLNEVMKRTDLCLKGQNTCLLYQECYYLDSLRPQEAFVRGVTPLVIYNLPLVLETRLQTEPDVASAVSTVTLWYKVRCQQLYENMFLNGASPNLNWNASKLCNSVLTRLLLEVGRRLIVIAAKSMSFSRHRVHSEKACS